MASLNEIRNRIASITSTKKITGAMKLVASAKLRKAQNRIDNFSMYNDALTAMLQNALQNVSDSNISIGKKTKEETRFAVLAFSSNGTLCGAFNHNVTRALDAMMENPSFDKAESISFYGFGKRVSQHIQKNFIDTDTSGRLSLERFDELTEKPDYLSVARISDQLLEKIGKGEIHRLIVVYNHFKNRGVQILRQETVFPISAAKKQTKRNDVYIFEPDATALCEALIPSAIKNRIFGTLLDSCAAEHAARANAMQAATENAEDIIGELRMQYNRVRQEAITSEILDIIGGAEAINKNH